MGALHGLAIVYLLLVILRPANAILPGTHTKPHKLVAISNCAELKRALEQTWPPTDILVPHDIFCSSKAWGPPVVIKTARAILGIRTQPHPVPNIDFGDVHEGIVVAPTAKLKFETLSLVSTVPQDTSQQNLEGTQPLPALKVERNGTVDFVGVWMCCQNCMMGPTQVYIDQRPNEEQDRINLGVDGIEALEVGDFSPEDTQSEGAYIKWLEGEFASGGIYHMCATMLSCNVGTGMHSAFMYFMDNSIEMCRSNPTVVILSQDPSKGSHIPMLVAVLVISISTAVCLVMGTVVALLVKSRRKMAGRFHGLRGIDSHRASVRPLESDGGAHENIDAVEADQADVEPDDDVVEISGNALSFNEVRVDLTKLLGRGGFSSVYEGTYQGRIAAIKIVEHSQRVMAHATGELAEVKLHEHLAHPYIVMTYCSKVVPIDAVCLNSSLRSSPTISVGPEGSSSNGKAPENQSVPEENSSQGREEAMCTLIVMEYCEKGNLFEAIHKGEFFRSGLKGVPDLNVILRSALDVASAMRYLHAQGIVHGDLKPENVLRKELAEDERGFICKISDFGLSRTVPINTFLQTATLGTITHMPPELLRDGILGPAADVYSFGIMLWEMLSGNIPFKGQGHHDIILGVVAGSRPAMPNNVPRGMSALIEDCWRENHLRRPTFVHVIGRLQGIIYEVQRHLSAPFSRLLVPSPCESYQQPPTEDWMQSCSKSVLSSTTPTNTPRHLSTSPSSEGSPVIWDCINSSTPTPQDQAGGEDSGQLWCASVCGMNPAREAPLRTESTGMNFMELQWKNWRSSGKTTTPSDSYEQQRGMSGREQVIGRDMEPNPPSPWNSPDRMRGSPEERGSGKISPVIFPEQTNRNHHVLNIPDVEMSDSNAKKGPREWDDVDPTYLNSCLEIDWDAVHPGDPRWNTIHFSPNDLTSAVTTISTYEVDSEPFNRFPQGPCLQCQVGSVKGEENENDHHGEVLYSVSRDSSLV
ncbi:hypothetical protein BSKO_08777 [Bryopsis sp. KO-2023]|nr:hypothetical protein BSKO_08777 [Bryopsis sp. KO-2023]